MDHVKVGRVGPFPRVSKPVFLTSVILITVFIIFGAFFNEQAEVVLIIQPKHLFLYVLDGSLLW